MHDNVGFAEALAGGLPVVPIFIFDTEILERLEDRDDLRVQFIHQRVLDLHEELVHAGSALTIKHGRPLAVWKELLKRYEIRAVYFNHDYEPAAIERDAKIRAFLEKAGVAVRSFKDQVIFERDEVQKDSGGPYTVFTPYSKKWKASLSARDVRPANGDLSNLLRVDQPLSDDHLPPSLERIGFRPKTFSYPEAKIDRKRMAAYAKTRDWPAQAGTSHLSLHLRFGTISIRELVSIASKTSETYLNELIWREFFMQILFHFPYAVDGPFRPEYSAIAWRQDEEQFAAWCEGRTGYPLVDAGMRELNATGFMHNRVRMVTASFLAKHLLMDWRWGEAYFARKLLDFDLAANNGNWQWVAGTGCDAAPYFRIFNPEAQQKKFDPDMTYIRQWVPEYGTSTYPTAIVEHALARARALREYKAALAGTDRLAR
ncbi:MAG: DNA photolyase family protein [Bdellovibrionaceae bacterium]|nr:DNA photolyase family protein [Pseudobdellovibrionaceae bacterium]